MSTSYPLFNTLTVSLTYWVIFRTSQRVFCLDDSVALYYQFHVGIKGKKTFAMLKLIKDRTAY